MIHNLFELFNTDQTGHLSYRECIQALAMMNYEQDGTGRDRLCFTLCNPGEDGLVDKADLQSSLENGWGGSPEQLTHIMAEVPEKVDFDAFCQLTAASYKVTLAIMSAVPESF